MGGGRFCGACGAALPAVCLACGTANPAWAKFCGHCGGALGEAGAAQLAEPDPSPINPEPAVARSAERRQVTVMFCDLVGSTALASRLDPEDLRAVLGAYHGCCAEVIRSAGGFVAKYQGDGVLAYFGYPEAREDDAEQAVRAALALIEAVPRIEGAVGSQVRIGIATGFVVLGELIGARAAKQETAVGDTPRLAERLQEIAEPNAVVVAESTRRQIGRLFETVDLGPQAVSGFAVPTRAWRVLAENRVLGRFEALRSRAIPLVGREEELDLLLRCWAKAKSGRGQVVLISGEPGVGKSRLVEALAERVAAEPHVRLRYFCSPHHQDSALYLVITQLERAAGFARDDAPAVRLAKLQALLAPTAPPREDAALIAELLSLPISELAKPLDATPERKKQRTFEALLRQGERLSARQPLLSICEDLQWIDPSSRDLLDQTIERLAHWPALYLLTCRPEFRSPWTERPEVTPLVLGRLDQRDTVLMVAKIAGNRAFPPAILQEIADRADGVPLFIEELTKAVLESGEPVTPAAPHPPPSVPATLYASLMARLDRLGPAAKELAQRAAVIGREFPHDLLAAIADLPEPELREALARLTSSGLVFAHGAPPQASYTFKHALVQDAAYGTLLRGRRQQLHTRIGTVLEDTLLAAPSTPPEILAHHFTEAGQPERAVGFWLKAGQQALQRSAMEEAERLLRRGLALVANVPESDSTQEQELDLQIALGRALIATHGWGAPEIGEAYARARELCDRLNRPRKLLPVLYGQFVHQALRAHLDTAQELAGEMRWLGEAQNDVVVRVMGYRGSGYVSLAFGDFVAARDYLELSLGLYDPAERAIFAELTAQEIAPTVLSFLACVLACSGHLDQARLRRDAALTEAGRLSHAFTSAYARWWDWLVGWIARAGPAVLLQSSEKLLALSVHGGFAYWRAMATANRGWCLAALGQPEQGIPLLASGMRAYHATGNTQFTPLFLTTLADAHRIAGNPEAGLEQLAEAERLAETTKERIVLAETLRLRGDLLLLGNDRAGAEASFTAAIAVARRQAARLFELRATTSLARLWRAQGRGAEARDLLAPIYDWFTEGFDAPDLVEAQALLRELALR